MELVYRVYNQSNFNIMNTFSKQYETAKNNSIEFMKNGQISAYLNSLLEMNKYKRLMVAVVAN
jgi:hypothetical protein